VSGRGSLAPAVPGAGGRGSPAPGGRPPRRDGTGRGRGVGEPGPEPHPRPRAAGRKFDLRLYCLVLSFRPLNAYLHRGGFARFASDAYKVTRDNLGDLETHLTNHAITKNSDNYTSETGNKWGVGQLKVYLMTEYGEERTNALFADIQAVIVKSLQACQEMIVQDRHCFELYGYDIMVDEDLKAWLIEVNAQPALSADTAQDRELKMTVVSDVLDTLDLEYARGAAPLPAAVGGFDAILADDQPQRPHPRLGSMLGCAYPPYSQAAKESPREPPLPSL